MGGVDDVDQLLVKPVFFFLTSTYDTRLPHQMDPHPFLRQMGCSITVSIGCPGL
jgi:hypothetical protein